MRSVCLYIFNASIGPSDCAVSTCFFSLNYISTLIYRVEEYIRSGKDRNIVDPDPNGLYTKRKQQRHGVSSSKDPVNTDLVASSDQASQVHVSYPENGWGYSLSKMPLFTRAEMDKHVAKSGKNIGNKNHHSVPTTLRKAKTFLEDEYLRDIVATSDQQCFYFKAKCCHSYRKNDPPHQLKLALCIHLGDVLDSSCTCVAGKVGFCNHISALMLKICKFSLYKSKTTKDLRKEEDENPQLACTSQLQQWSQKGGGENIVPQPVMEVVVKKTKLDERSTSRVSGSGIKCLLNEARKQPKYDGDTENVLMSELEKIDPNLGFVHMSKAKSLNTELKETKFGKSPVGSFLSYQTALTESNFSASKFQSITKRQRNHGSFAESIMHPKPFSSKYVAHGIKYEPIALQEYQKFMVNNKTPVTVLRSGFVVSKSCPVLGASPDARIIDKGCSICFGLGEVKCPYTKSHVTPLEACSDPNFFMEKVNDSDCRPKRDHEYYTQVQGQMGVTGAQWCDFIVYTSKGLYVERIPFDPAFWQNLRRELLNYYFTHFIQFAADDYQ